MGYAIWGAVLLCMINVVPIIMYSKQVKKLAALVYSRKTYNKIIATEESFERLEKNIEDRIK